MKLYLDTANDDFVLATFDENLNLKYSKVLQKYQKKVELIPLSISEMLNELNVKISDFDEFYTNLGPGYFTGVRISLVYLRTIATIKKIKIFTVSTMQILSQQNKGKNAFYINAKGEKYFEYLVNQEPFDPSQITCKTGIKDNYDSVNYEQFLNNFNDYKQLFIDYDDLNKIEPYYIKMPQIGAKK
ncbi:tRNA (adenosine(37)-N6)-threonylcarbamoyltransferase complex dimerization subunit type 1 TsaB [Mycoplasmopsis agalactiae]|uniref:tRNA (adenosine(37)-N6)-threonylcarbamoyltransferase complex dimerization subunit type 1 TsaB n=1 Tax=Mycoplasmopsis agalactiae TaxID=2110 RepID=UPI002F3EE774